MTDADALLAAILADPADDTVRLAYADHLDETGEHDRAEFIRVQVELAAVGAMESVRGKLATLRRRERELLVAVADELRPAVPYSWAVFTEPRDRCDTPYSVVSRGFVSQVACNFATLFGGPCGVCRGRGELDESSAFGTCQVQCSDCDGKGHTQGVAAELFRRHPVQGVTLVGLEPRPVLFPNNRQTRYVWDVDSRDRASPSTIPHALWEDIRSHESAQAAKDWLSTKCVRLGRERAKAANTNQGGNNDRAQGG